MYASVQRLEGDEISFNKGLWLTFRAAEGYTKISASISMYNRTERWTKVKIKEK